MRAATPGRSSSLAALVVLLGAGHAGAQVNVRGETTTLTVEAWANTEFVAGGSGSRADDADFQVDGALRGLLLLDAAALGRIGARAVVDGRGGASDDLAISERSLIWTGRFGRVEYGERQGLPDVLTGYAPNPFSFTTAEFGPASGLSLDPAGGIVSLFAPDAVAASLDDLALLGYGASYSSDRARKLIYVSPRSAGWLAGVSHATDADGPGADKLTQAGLVHETYAGQTVLRAGATWSRLSPEADRDLDSYHAGASVSLDETWLLGIAATWNPHASAQPLPGWRSDATGVSASLNYNRGPWTAGGFVQQSRGREAAGTERDRLRAVEAGVSYRTSTKLRVFLSWYRYILDGRRDFPASDDNLIIAGLRITL